MCYKKNINFYNYEFRLDQEMSVTYSSNLSHENNKSTILIEEQTNNGKM